ncbi:transmembrane ascorbate-dependent reductase CYB561 isoform X1 [Aquarana catesbeiana]|uniref:transmembrane ascorbate-dependent reductase CYB561 isoform X1 n=1 Tax=Aquarana catesbeiana TaxID=8400 RepID=UPI003CC9AECD
MEDSLSHQNTGFMPYLVATSQILGVAVLAITGTWLSRYRGGFSWEGPEQFNVHPLCMVLGMVFLCGDALLVYRVFRHETKRATKILHGALHILALIISLVGIIAVFQFHQKKKFPDMYSIHSWLGIATFSFYILQWIIGFIVFFVPGLAFAYKTFYKPLHIFFGMGLLVTSIATCLLGLTEKVLFSIPNPILPERCTLLTSNTEQSPKSTDDKEIRQRKYNSETHLLGLCLPSHTQTSLTSYTDKPHSKLNPA